MSTAGIAAVAVGVGLHHRLEQQLAGGVSPSRATRPLPLDQRRRVERGELVAALVVDHLRGRCVEREQLARPARDLDRSPLDLGPAAELVGEHAVEREVVDRIAAPDRGGDRGDLGIGSAGHADREWTTPARAST